MPPAGAAREKVPRNNLTEKQRHRLIEHLLEGSTKGVLGQGAINEAAETFSCSRYQVSGIWKCYQKQRSDGVTDINLRNGRGGHSGRKGIDVEKLTAALVEVPLKNRTTQRAVAKQLGIPQQTLQRNLKKLGMRAASRQEVKALKLVVETNHKEIWSLRNTVKEKDNLMKKQSSDHMETCTRYVSEIEDMRKNELEAVETASKAYAELEKRNAEIERLKAALSETEAPADVAEEDSTSSPPSGVGPASAGLATPRQQVGGSSRYSMEDDDPDDEEEEGDGGQRGRGLIGRLTGSSKKRRRREE